MHTGSKLKVVSKVFRTHAQTVPKSKSISTIKMFPFYFPSVYIRMFIHRHSLKYFYTYMSINKTINILLCLYDLNKYSNV